MNHILSEPESKNKAAVHFYLTKLNDENVNNVAVLKLSKVIKHVMTSASEEETEALL